MADLTITVSNTLTIFGEDFTQKWGTMIWGTNNWGIENDFLAVEAGKLIEDSIGSDSSILSLEPIKLLSNSMSLGSDIVTIELSDGSGYKYVFVKPTTNSDSRNNSTYTQGTRPSSTYATVAKPSTTWS